MEPVWGQRFLNCILDSLSRKDARRLWRQMVIPKASPVRVSALRSFIDEERQDMI